MAENDQRQKHVQADTVNLSGTVNDVQARQINVDRGGIGRAQGGTMTVSVSQGGIGALSARYADVTIARGGIGALAAQEANVHDTSVAALAANKVILSGNARVLFDLRAGVLTGLIAGAVLGALNVGRRWRVSMHRDETQ